MIVFLIYTFIDMASHHQIGGVVIGEGGYGSVHTIDDLPPGNYTVDFVNLKDGAIHSLPATREELVKRLGHRVVYKNVTHVSSHQNDDGGGNSNTKTTDDSKRARPRRRFLAEFMERWSNKEVGKEERAKWDFFTQIARKGVRFPPVNTLMPLYRQGDDVFLSIRNADVLFPLYRYMHGDLVTFGHYYNTTVGNLIDIATAVLDCLTALQVFGGIHHVDIKPENVLFRVRGVRPKAAPPKAESPEETRFHGILSGMVAAATLGGIKKKEPEFVLSDFGSAVSNPSFRDLRDARGTPGYLCPLVYDTFDEFRADHERLFRKYAVAPAGMESRLTAEALWESFGNRVVQRSMRTLDVDEAMMKNDLYALGATLLNFVYPSHVADVPKLAVNLMSGDESAGGIWKIVVAQDVIEGAKRNAIARNTKDTVLEFYRVYRHRMQQEPKPRAPTPAAVKPATVVHKKNHAPKTHALFDSFFSQVDTNAVAPPPSQLLKARRQMRANAAGKPRV